MVVKKMAKSRISYLNGLAIVCIVFISLSIIPVGVLSGVMFSEGGYNNHTFTVAPEGNYTLEMDIKGDLMFYYDIYDYPTTYDYEIYLVELSDYELWNSTADPRPDESVLSIFGAEENFKWVRTYGDDHVVIFFNDDNVTTLDVDFFYFTADRAQIIGGLAVGLIFGLFTAILALHTAAYFLRILIIIPIFGFRYSNGDDKRRRGSYSYQYEAPRTPRAPAAPAAPAAKAARATPAIPAAPRAPRAPHVPITPVKRGPALRSISENYTVAGQPKQYPKDGFKRFFVKTWDHSSIAEKVLLLVAFFFLLTGAVTGTWYVIVVFPLVLVGIAITVFFTNRNRREKLIKIVESYQAIYVRDAARILRTAPEFLRSDAWKIINLGLGTIAYDTSMDILFDASKVDPVKAKELSPESEKIHAELVSEVTEKDVKEEKEVKVEEVVEAKEVDCPFCESSNPPDSSFCIKCGASLKPAK